MYRRLVIGIGPIHRTNRGIAQPGSAAVLGTAGRWFESSCPDQPDHELPSGAEKDEPDYATQTNQAAEPIGLRFEPAVEASTGGSTSAAYYSSLGPGNERRRRWVSRHTSFMKRANFVA